MPVSLHARRRDGSWEQLGPSLYPGDPPGSLGDYTPEGMAERIIGFACADDDSHALVFSVAGPQKLFAGGTLRVISLRDTEKIATVTASSPHPLTVHSRSGTVQIEIRHVSAR